MIACMLPWPWLPRTVMTSKTIFIGGGLFWLIRIVNWPVRCGTRESVEPYSILHSEPISFIGRGIAIEITVCAITGVP